MIISDDPFLSAAFGRPAYRVEVSDADTPDVCGGIAAHRAAQDAPAFYFAKVASADVAAVRTLSASGFYVVDVNVTLAIDGGRALDLPLTPGVDVVTCTPADADAVLDIAATAFRYSRFHQDPQVAEGVANRIKRDWVANYVHGRRGERLMVARVNGRVAGFLAVLASGPAAALVRTIDLIAVDERVQGRGVGRALVAAFLRTYAPTSARLQVGTQVANVPSLRLYETLGMRVHGSAYVLHMHSMSAEAVPA